MLPMIGRRQFVASNDGHRKPHTLAPKRSCHPNVTANAPAVILRLPGLSLGDCDSPSPDNAQELCVFQM
jgi:hypothetical protein